MNVRRRVLAVAAAAGVALAPLVVSSTSASAAPGTKSLATVLLADTNAGAPSFDNNSRDFDILTAAVLGVLDAKPGSAVSVLTDGNVKLTAFLPTDAAFTRTGKALGLTAKTEAKLAGKYVNALGVDGLESVLLYHVVPGAKINAAAAMQADGAKLDTALGQKITVNVTKKGLFLKDRANDGVNPKVIVTNINKGNKQIAHAISRVLLPAA